MATIITITNPFSGAVIEQDISDLTQEQLEAFPLEERICNELHAEIAPCTPGEFLAAYADRVGPEEAGRLILGS